MPRRIYIQRLVNLEQTDYWTVHRYADEKGLGGKGFSAALRMIIREWREHNQLEPLPSHTDEETQAAINDALKQVLRPWRISPQPNASSPASNDDPA